MSETALNPIPAGGAGEVFASIDSSNVKDQALIRQAVKNWPKRWRGLTDDFKDKVISGLDIGLEVASRTAKTTESSDFAIRAASAIASIGKTVAMMEKQMQDDEHLQDKNTRLDAGLATERVAVEPVIIRKAI